MQRTTFKKYLDPYRKTLSELGFIEIPNFTHYLIAENGEIYSFAKTWHKKKSISISNNGYPSVSLKRDDGKIKIVTLHKILANLFLPNPNNFKFINHKNGIKTDFTLKNLEWCSASHNILHAYELGLNKNRKLSTKKVKEIRRNRTKVKVLANRYGVSTSTIRNVRNNKVWRHLL